MSKLLRGSALPLLAAGRKLVARELCYRGGVLQQVRAGCGNALPDVVHKRHTAWRLLLRRV